MSSNKVAEKPHAVCIPSPTQSHVKAMLKLAKLLYSKGFHITFVNTEFNHKRLLKSRGPNSLDGLPDFRFETIPDGLPSTDNNLDATQNVPSLAESITNNFLAPFADLLSKLNQAAAASSSRGTPPPPVTCIISDGFMSFTLTAGEEIGVPVVLLFTIAACGLMGFYQHNPLMDKGLTPLKDASYLVNGYLDTIIDWIPGMKDIRLRDFPSFVRTTDPKDVMLHFVMKATERAEKATAIIVQTFEALEKDVLRALSQIYTPPIYSIGPLQLLLNQKILENGDSLKFIGYNLWEEDTECLEWLDSKEHDSVIYVNFGSIEVMSSRQMVEFAWGLANSGKYFLWIIRPDQLVAADDTAVLPPEFMVEIEERGLIVSWCPQEQVLNHPSVGGFLTHCGWNSTIESLSAGVPMLCWPVSGDQPTNCRFICNEWEMGMEVENEVRREEVERVVRELMDGEQGKRMKKKALEWKKLAEKATGPQGSSYVNLDELVEKLLQSEI